MVTPSRQLTTMRPMSVVQPTMMLSCCTMYTGWSNSCEATLSVYDMAFLVYRYLHAAAAVRTRQPQHRRLSVCEHLLKRHVLLRYGSFTTYAGLAHPSLRTHQTARPTATITQLHAVTQGETWAQTLARLQGHTGVSADVQAWPELLQENVLTAALAGKSSSPPELTALAGLLLLLRLPACKKREIGVVRFTDARLPWAFPWAAAVLRQFRGCLGRRLLGLPCSHGYRNSLVPHVSRHVDGWSCARYAEDASAVDVLEAALGFGRPAATVVCCASWVPTIQ
jgi:hypothetical protein